jgi:isochorismate synthase
MRIWRAPNAEAFVGLGSARVFDGLDFRDNVRRFRDFATRAEQAIPAFAASAFDARSESADEWAEFRRCEVVVPTATIAFRGEDVELIVCNDATNSDALLKRVEAALGSSPPGQPTPPTGLDYDWDDPAFEERVAAALDRLQSDESLEKVVVARRLSVSTSRPWRMVSTLDGLRRSYPECFEFAWRRGDSVFLGATPERLVRVRGGRASTGALAGSARRGAERREDERLGQALLHSKKDREEHDVVTRMIVETLDPISSDVRAEEAPELMKLSNVQHLYTRVDAELEHGIGIGEVAGRLHPTPAVGGMPRDAAVAAIGELEDFDRGLYSGFVGWIDSDGDGDLAVAIRSGLLRGERAYLYAGGGIVPDSRPADEAAETRTKLGAMLDALRGDTHA